jgi:hypothetical protein
MDFHQQYDNVTGWEYLIKSYCTIHSILDKAQFQHVMDFGAGTGIGEWVGQQLKTPVMMESYDMDQTRTDLWGESNNEFFDKVAQDALEIDIKRFTPLAEDSFELIDPPQKKFDGVVAFRFPPLNHKWIGVDEMRRALQPYCVDGFSLLYCHISIGYLRDMGLAGQAQFLDDLYTNDRDKCIYNSKDLTVFEL